MKFSVISFGNRLFMNMHYREGGEGEKKYELHSKVCTGVGAQEFGTRK